MKRRFETLACIWLGGHLSLSSAQLLAQTGITQEGPLTVFRTGGDQPLLTLALPFEVPALSTLPTLRFDFGFATAEPDVAGSFFDSFSVTLQSQGRSATALLLTADRTGVQWAPLNPGGLTLNPVDVEHTDSVFPDLSPTLELADAYSVTLELPAELTGRSASLFFDLFDNLNAYASLAYVRYARIETSGAGPRLHSAANVAGTYTEESNVVLDPARRTFSLRQPVGDRFYRVFADKPTRITRIRAVGDGLEIEYAFLELKLHSAAVVGGPYGEEPDAMLDAVNRTFSISRPASHRFYRILAEKPVRIVSIRAEGDRLVLKYAYPQLKLYSAAVVGGPYAEEPNAALDEVHQTFSLSKPLANRFYRIFSDGLVRISRLRVVAGQLTFDYELLP